MVLKIKSYEVKADNGMITGYASTWTREPDSYGDVVKQGAFAESIAKIEEEGKVLPLLFNHAGDDLKAYIGTVTLLKEDDHGLYFEAAFDDTKEAQRARQLAMDGRLAKFSFAYDIVEQGTIKLEDGREANELRKMNIHEVSLVLYPANPDTSVVVVKTAEKAGRRNSKADEEALRDITELLGQAQAIVNSLLIDEEGDEQKAKSEEPDTANDEEQKARIALLIKEADELLKKGENK